METGAERGGEGQLPGALTVLSELRAPSSGECVVLGVKHATSSHLSATLRRSAHQSGSQARSAQAITALSALAAAAQGLGVGICNVGGGGCRGNQKLCNCRTSQHTPGPALPCERRGWRIL